MGVAAQDYQCLQPGRKHYFTNSSGYLRGIRIDSVAAVGATTVYYPYHTPRGYYGPAMSGGPDTLDSTGGSWLGKKVYQVADGTFLFDNIWQDTIVVKTKAGLGDSWRFYDDGSSYYYQAKVVSVDTVSVYGAVDSVKYISITPYDSAGIVYSDSLINFRIGLSKNHGFVEVFDLHTFPYHAPDSSYRQGLDYYLDLVIMSAIGGGYAPLYSNGAFKLANWVNPAMNQLYDWNVGDVFENSVCVNLYQSSCFNPYRYYFDSIVNRTTVSGGTLYDYIGWMATQYIPPFFYVKDYGYAYKILPTSGTILVPNRLFIDSNLMPEEFLQPDMVVYHPGDTSCGGGTHYSLIETEVKRSKYQFFFEWTGIKREYKMGRGLKRYYFEIFGGPSWVEDTTLIYSRKSGVPCGSRYKPLDITATSEVHVAAAFSISPNPVSDVLTIRMPSSSSTTIKLINVLGATMLTIPTAGPEAQLQVSELPPGMYYLVVADVGGNTWKDKVVVAH